VVLQERRKGRQDVVQRSLCFGVLCGACCAAAVVIQSQVTACWQAKLLCYCGWHGLLVCSCIAAHGHEKHTLCTTAMARFQRCCYG
jgi:hypothetical protein